MNSIVIPIYVHCPPLDRVRNQVCAFMDEQVCSLMSLISLLSDHNPQETIDH